MRQERLVMKNALFVLGLVGLLSVVLMAGCSGSDSDDGDGDESTTGFSTSACETIGLKIANGEACELGDDPESSSIVELEIITVDGTATCTGVAINSSTVLSAGHCFSGGYISVVVNTFGGSYPAEAIVHPNYDESGDVVQNDAALVFTPYTMVVGTTPILRSRGPIVGEEAVVAGFGETSPGTGATTIHAGKAIISDTSTEHVVIQYTGDQAHPCAGDSGGPILVAVDGVPAVAGLVSQSDPSVPEENMCLPGDETIYTNTEDPSIYNFIQTYVGAVPTI